MSGFVEVMRRREKAEEDVYFARIDRALIAALRDRRSMVPAGGSPPPGQEATREGDQPGPDAGVAAG